MHIDPNQGPGEHQKLRISVHFQQVIEGFITFWLNKIDRKHHKS